MTNPNLSPAQKLYSSYFPEILQDSPSQTEYRFNSPLVKSDNDLNLVISNDGYFECKLSGMRGDYHQFHQSVEGMPISEEEEYKRTLSQNMLPSFSTIEQYSQELLTPVDPTVLNYLTKTRGLDTKTILENKIGYDEICNQLIFPILNATKSDITSVKYLTFPLDPGSRTNYTLGGTRLLNYHKIKFPVKKIEAFIFTRDIIDALFLNQIGYSVLCCVSDKREWAKEWNKLISGKKVIFINEKFEEILKFSAALDVEPKRIFNIDLGESISDSFIKGNKTKDDLDKILSQCRTFEEIKNNMEFIENAKALQEDTIDINPAQDFVNGKFYFGVVSNGKVNLISSDKKIITEDEFENNKFKLTNNEFNLCRFTLDGIKEFTVSNKQVQSSDIFMTLKSYLKKYIYFGEEKIYDLIPLWIMGTYVYQIFNHYPYIHIQAEKGSGKTFLMSLIEPFCFNGKHSAQDTGATLFREVENNARTLLLDELEYLSKKDSSSYQDVNRILNSGYSKGAVVTRPSGSSLKYYKTYSPKMFAGISEISDTLDSRSIKVLMKRKIKQDQLEAYRENAATLKFHQETRDNLYIFALQYAQEIHRFYSDTDVEIPILKEFSGRNYDLYAPLFIISKLIDSELNNEKEYISSSLFDYSQKEKELHIALDSATSEQSMMMESLNVILKQASHKKSEVVDGQNILYYLTDDILDLYNNLVENRRRKITKASLTQKLRKLEIENKPVNIDGQTKRCYIFNLAKLEDRAKRYEIEFSTEGIIIPPDAKDAKSQ